jgi:phosphoglycerate dehydrogenase-like enzyme
VHCGGSGYDHLLPLDRARTVLSNCAGVLAPYLAETVIGAIHALNGNFPGYLAQQRQRHWQSIPFRPLSEQSLMVIGLGAIGSAVAQKASAAGMRVLGASRSKRLSQSIDERFPLADLKNVIGTADVVTVHVPLNRETRRLIDRHMIEAMKPGAIFVNTARGDIVDEGALFDALKSKHIRAAYLDVFGQEPLPATSPFWDLDNIMITPHCADAIVGWARKYSDLFAINLARWGSGEPMLNLVAPPASGARSKPEGVSDV